MVNLFILFMQAGGTGVPVLPPPTNPIITDPSRLTTVYQNMVGQWFSTVAPYAYDLFYSLAALS